MQLGEADGLKLTATGNLARSVVEEMRQSFEWPGHDKASAFALHKVVNEPDFMHCSSSARPCKRRSVTASQRQAPAHKLGARACRPRSTGLAASDFVSHRCGDWTFVFRQGASRFLAAVRYGRVLWSLSTAASDWGRRKKLSRLCTIPNQAVLENKLEAPSRSRRESCTLVWFGSLIAEQNRIPWTSAQRDVHVIRKSNFRFSPANPVSSNSMSRLKDRRNGTLLIPIKQIEHQAA